MSNPVTTVNLKVRALDFRVSARLRDTGDELVLFVHGLGSSKENWQNAWQRPELRDRALLAPDLPGFGHSDLPAGFSPDLASYAQVLHALIDAYALRRIHLVAHSMGGSISLLLPERVLSRLASLVLIEPRLFLSSCGIASVAAGVTHDEYVRTVFPAIRRQMSSDPRAAFDLQRADIDAMYASSLSLIDWSSRRSLLERFELAECPKYFVCGADNQHLQELSFIEPEQVRVIDEAAHFVMVDNPDEFYRCLGQLLIDR